MFKAEEESLIRITSQLKNYLKERINRAKTMLALHFVKTGLINSRYIDYFKILLSRRTDVDYGDFEEIDKEKAKDSLEKAEEFLRMADRLMKDLILQL